MDKLTANNTAHFEKDGVRYKIYCITDESMKTISTDPETGQKRIIYGYPMYFTKSGVLYPLPQDDSIKVIYG